MMRALTCWLSLSLIAASVHAQQTAVLAGRLIDAEHGTTASNQVILVERGKVAAIFSGTAAPRGAAVIDLSDAVVMPGLFDAHTHMCLTVDPTKDAGQYYFTTLLNTTSYRAIQGVANARAMLHAGFTTIRDIGNSGNYGDVALRQAIEEGLVPGPTMQNAGRIIAPFGGQFHLQPEKAGLGRPEYFFADTHDELRKAVRENIHYGATLIKIVVDDQQYIYSVDDMRLVVEEAALAGLRVAAHVWTEQGAINAIEAGVATIEHGTNMSDETLLLAKERGVYLVGTEFTELAIQVTFFGTSVEEGHELHAQFIDRLRRAYDVGVPMAFGSDVVFAYEGHDRGTLTLTYLDNFEEADIPAAYALKMMTINAADAMGLGDERGAIRPGMAADIIAMPANPLDDLDALRSVNFVMKDGKVFRHDR